MMSLDEYETLRLLDYEGLNQEECALRMGVARTTVTVIAESTPGPIAINCATYVGYKQKGIRGAVAATLGVVLPSFIIIYLISVFLNDFLEITWISNAFKGIRIAVGILILDAGINMFIKMKKKVITCVIMGCSFLVMLLFYFGSRNLLKKKISPIILIVFSAVFGVAVYGG